MASGWQKVRTFLGEFAGGLLTAVVLLLFIVSIPLIEPFVQHFWVLQERVSHAIHPIIAVIGISLLWLAIAFVILLATDDDLLIEKPRSFLNCVLTSMAAASPVLTLLLWYYLGVPRITSYYTFFGIDFYYVGIITFLVAYLFLAIRTIKLPRLPARMRRLSGWTVVIGANLFFLITPVGWVLADARLRFGPSEASDIQPGNCQPNTSTLIAHISDLHLNLSANGRTRDGYTPGNKRLPVLLTKIHEMRPEYLVVSGDIADTGDVDQWETFKTEITKHLPGTNVIMSAGNHDLNLFFADNNLDQYDDFEANDVSKIDHMPRLARFLYIQSEYMPRMLAAKGQAISEVMQQAPTRDNLASSDIVQEAYRNCRAMVEAPGTVRAGCEIGASWDWRGARQLYYSRLKKGFPLTFIDERSGVAFASLLSPSIDTSSPGENAVGLIDEDQTHTLAEFAHALPPSIKLLVVTLHHPLFPRGPIELGAPNVKSLFDLYGIWQEIYDSRWFSEIFLQNETKHATALVAALKHELKKRSDLQILFMFGHRHERSLKKIAGMIFEEAPNVATSNSDDWGFWAVKAGYGRKLEIQWCHMDAESQNKVH